MKLSKFVRGCVVVATCSGMMSAQLAQAAGAMGNPATVQAAVAGPKIQDVALQEQGVFAGTVVDEQGAARASLPVIVSRQGQVIARTETNTAGQFSVSNLTGGVYTVQTPVGTNIYRLWAPRTAPPGAQPLAMIVPNETVVRGQLGLNNGGGGALSWLANPWVLAGVVAAAIAIPLALDDDDAS